MAQGPVEEYAIRVICGDAVAVIGRLRAESAQLAAPTWCYGEGLSKRVASSAILAVCRRMNWPSRGTANEYLPWRFL